MSRDSCMKRTEHGEYRVLRRKGLEHVVSYGEAKEETTNEWDGLFRQSNSTYTLSFEGECCL